MSRRRGQRPTLFQPEPISGLVGRVECGTSASQACISREVWEAALGARIAERTQPVELAHGTLVVRVATSVWATEMGLLSVPIIARLRAAGVTVTALRCRVGTIDPPARAPAPRRTRTVPPAAALPDGLRGTLEQIADPDLRASIASAAQANLAWQSYVTPKVVRDEGSRAARVPQSAERGSDPPAQTSGAAHVEPRRRP